MINLVIFVILVVSNLFSLRIKESVLKNKNRFLYLFHFILSYLLIFIMLFLSHCIFLPYFFTVFFYRHSVYIVYYKLRGFRSFGK